MSADDSEAVGDWYLKEWAAHFGKRQAGLVNELGWDKSKANFVWHSRQQYRREDVNAVAGWLGIEPFELLMPPKEAIALRRLRETAVEIARSAAALPQAAEARSAWDGSPPLDSIKRRKKGA